MADPTSMEIDPTPSSRAGDVSTAEVVTTQITTNTEAVAAEPVVTTAMEVDPTVEPDSEPRIISTTHHIEQTTTTITIPQGVAPSDVFGIAPEKPPSPIPSVDSPTSPMHALPTGADPSKDVDHAPGPSFVDPISTFNPPQPEASSSNTPNALDSVIQQTPIQVTAMPRIHRTGYVYDPLMMLHCADGYTPTADDKEDSGGGHPEEPMRIRRIFTRLAEHGLIKRMKKLPFKEVTYEQTMLVHSQDHWDKVQGTECRLLLLPMIADE